MKPIIWMSHQNGHTTVNGRATGMRMHKAVIRICGCQGDDDVDIDAIIAKLYRLHAMRSAYRAKRVRSRRRLR